MSFFANNRTNIIISKLDDLEPSNTKPNIVRKDNRSKNKIEAEITIISNEEKGEDGAEKRIAYHII